MDLGCLVGDGDAWRVTLQVLADLAVLDDVHELLTVNVFLFNQHIRHLVQHRHIAGQQVLGTPGRRREAAAGQQASVQ